MVLGEIIGGSGIFVDGDWIESKDQNPAGDVRLIQLADIGAGDFTDKSNRYITSNKATELNCTFLKKGDILIARLGDPLCKACMFPLDGKYITAVDVAIFRTDRQDISRKYLVYLLNSPWFKGQVKKYESGTTRKRISRKNLNKIELPIPPLPEQERIVARIEELFSQLDSGVETLKKTKEQLAVYRQAVLKEAFSSCVERVSVESVCQHVTDGDHMPPPKTKQGIPFIMISNIDNHVIDWSNTAFVGDEYYNTIDTKRSPSKGDVLYTVTGSYGIPVLIDYEKRFCFQRHIALLRPKNCINQKFLYYAMQEPAVYAQATKGATGTAQKTVGLAVLRKIQIPFSDDIDTQTEIVNDIEAKLSLCDSIEKTVDTALQQAEAMRQSILKKAFEGGKQ